MADHEVNYFDHLNELRFRLLVMLASIAVLTIVSFMLSDYLVAAVTAPIKRSVSNLYFLVPYEAFLIRLKVSVTSGIVLSSPIIFTLLWSFVAPGLYRKEKNAMLPIVLASVTLFISGVLFAYFLVIPLALQFFLGFQTPSIQPMISVGSYVSFFLSLILMFGGIFVMPVALVGLMAFGIVEVDSLKRRRKAVIVIAFIVAAILTPTMDIVTQCLAAFPIWGLFEISLIVGKVLEVRRNQKKETA